MGLIDPGLPIDPITAVAVPLDDSQKADAARILNTDASAFREDNLKAVTLGTPDDGIAVYRTPADRREPMQLGAIVLKLGAPPTDMYRLILGLAKEGLALGHTVGRAERVPAAMTLLLARTFRLRLTESGWEARTNDEVKAGKPAVPVVYDIEVDLPDVIEQLEAALA